MASSEQLKVIYSESAQKDLKEIWRWNAKTYCLNHADKYIEQLKTKICILESDPHRGTAIIEYQDLRGLLIKKRNSKHGHMAFYKINQSTIYIARILHTAMNWQIHLDGNA